MALLNVLLAGGVGGGLQANASRCSGLCAVGSCVGEERATDWQTGRAIDASRLSDWVRGLLPPVGNVNPLDVSVIQAYTSLPSELTRLALGWLPGRHVPWCRCSRTIPNSLPPPSRFQVSLRASAYHTAHPAATTASVELVTAHQLWQVGLADFIWCGDTWEPAAQPPHP